LLPRRANTDICGDTKTDLFRTTQCGGGERFKNAEGKTLHKCQKPYDLIETLLLTHSNRGDRVMDPFLGTGTTAEAAVRWERKFWGIERDPEYFARARDRATSVLGWTFPNKNEDFEDDYA
jgi:DNA modification methylase